MNSARRWGEWWTRHSPCLPNMACQALTQSNPYPSHRPIFTTLRFPSGHTGFVQSLIRLLLLGLCTCYLPFWFHLPSPFCLLWGLSSDSPSAEKPHSLSIWVPTPCVFAPWLPTDLDSQMLCKSPLKGIIHQLLKGISHTARQPQFCWLLTKDLQLVNMNIFVSKYIQNRVMPLAYPAFQDYHSNWWYQQCWFCSLTVWNKIMKTKVSDFQSICSWTLKM